MAHEMANAPDNHSPAAYWDRKSARDVKRAHDQLTRSLRNLIVAAQRELDRASLGSPDVAAIRNICDTRDLTGLLSEYASAEAVRSTVLDMISEEGDQ